MAIIVAALAAWVAGTAPGHATLITLTASLDGAQEVNDAGVPNQGDPNGSGTALVVIDDVALTVDWVFDFSDIDLPLSAAHIHRGAFGVKGPPIVDFSAQPSGSDLFDPDLAEVLANPEGFYVNLHNQAFPDGAIRGQLELAQAVPEPAGLALLGVAVLATMMLIGRRRAAAPVRVPLP